MSEMQVYIANLGKYNEGELVGDWFTLPVDYEDVAERIGLNDEYEEYAIHDYEMPIKIPEYTSLESLNNLAEMLEDISDEAYYSDIDEMIGYWFDNLEDLVEHRDDIIYYSDCDSMENVAYDAVEDGLFGDVNERLQIYIDYDRLGRDMEINGNFLTTRNGVFEYMG